MILWVTSDLCGSTSVQQSPVVETTTVSGSAIPVALISRNQDDLTDGNITETTFEACKEEYCIVVSSSYVKTYGTYGSGVFFFTICLLGG